MKIRKSITSAAFLDSTSYNRHFFRVCRYFRPSDYIYGATATAGLPGALLAWEVAFPTRTLGTGGFAPAMRLAGVLGLGAGFLIMYERSARESWPY